LVRGGSGIRKRSAAIAALLLLTACGSRSAATNPPSTAEVTATPFSTGIPSTSAVATAAATPTPGGTTSPSTSATPAAPSVTCMTGGAAHGLVLMGRAYAGYLLYDVTDPVHPKLLCRISSTSVQIESADSIAYLKPVSATETDVMVRSLQSGGEARAATFPLAPVSSPFADPSWRPDGSLLAYSPPLDSSRPDSSAEVWLFANQSLQRLTTYPWPLTDCICRFGFPPQENALSPDGQYVVSGWPVGKGASPYQVSRVADRSQVQVFGLDVTEVLWDRTGHRLFLIGQSGVRSWTPEAGINALPNASQWTFIPSLSPDGTEAAYTAYIDQAQTQPRVFVYDRATSTTRQLSSRPRTQVMFVKSGWVWYLEEATCQADQPQCPPWGSAPTGKVYAQALPNGQETEVVFGSGEAPPAGNWSAFQPQDLWPRS